jgi:pimeloyl-ACP methyl ester carboxylesterase
MTPSAIAGLAALLAIALLPAAAAREHPPAGHFIEIDGVRLHFLETGPETAPRVLILHGASANLEEMRLALEAELGEHRAVWLDRPGLGWSERPGGRWSPEREAGLIAAFLAERNAGPAVVIAHSWGGAIALRLAMDYPEAVTGLVLVAPAVRAWVGEAAFYNRATHWPVIGPLITRVIAPTFGRTQLESGARSAFDPESMPENYVEDSALALILRAGPWKANADDMARVNEHLAAQEERYAQITHPAIVFAGPGDTVLATDRHSVPVAGTMPNAELRLIDGAGHNLHHSRASDVAAAVGEVRARAAAGGQAD